MHMLCCTAAVIVVICMSLVSTEVSDDNDFPEDSTSTTIEITTTTTTKRKPARTTKRITTLKRSTTRQTTEAAKTAASDDFTTEVPTVPNMPSKKAVFGLTDDKEDMLATSATFSNKDGSVTLTRCQHYIGNYPVWNSGGVLVETVVPDPTGGSQGLMAISAAASTVNKQAAPLYSKGLASQLQRALPVDIRSRRACQNLVASAYPLSSPNVTNITSRRYIYDKSYGALRRNASDLLLIDDVVVYGTLKDGGRFSYRCHCNSYTGQVLTHWNNMPTAIYGGNPRIGKYEYGSGDRPNLPFTRGSNGKCRFVSEDENLIVFDAKSSSYLSTLSLSSEFDCETGPSDAQNGAFGVLADLFFNAMRAREMYLNSSWGGLSKVVSTGKLEILGHYSSNFDNAQFDSTSKQLLFGDGGTKFYPLGTCLDIVGHEMGHAVTDMCSGLIYFGESGCINEAFSDAMGEMTKAYVLGSNDFEVSGACMKTKPYLRTMMSPRLYSDFFPVCPGDSGCQEVHNCSGIVNYAFYKLATSPGWSTQLAGRAFIAANKVAWGTATTIRQAGCDVANVVSAVGIANGDFGAVVRAWEAVGINITDCAPSAQQPKKPSNTSNNETIVRIDNCSKQNGLSANKLDQLNYVVPIPATATNAWIQISADNGDADLYFEYGHLPTKSSYSSKSTTSKSQEFIMTNVTQPGSDGYIMVRAYKPFYDLWLYACFY